MKIVYEPGEIERIESVYEENKDHFSIFSDTEPDRIYGLKFKVTNPALAQYILPSWLNGYLADFDMGIEIQSIEFNVQSMSISELKRELHEAIDNIL